MGVLLIPLGAIVVVGVCVASAFALAKASDFFIKLTEGDEKWQN